MAISQGFNLPPTGRIGKTTTGHRSGNYNLRVIPDVDDNVERSDKQNNENRKFGFLSSFFLDKKEALSFGFPKIYQKLNYAIKVNYNNIIFTNNKFKIELEKFIVSKKRNLAEASFVSSRCVPFENDIIVEIKFVNDVPGNKNPTDKIYVYQRYIEENKIYRYTASYNRSRNVFYSIKVKHLLGKHIEFKFFFYNDKEECSTAIYVPPIMIQ